MKKEPKQTSDTNETAQQEQNVGYPDISKADTKTVVLLSFIVIVIVFILSIVFPQSSTVDSTTEQATTTEVTTEVSNTETDTSGLFDTNNQSEASATAEVFSVPEETAPGFCTINGQSYYLQEGETPFTGWLIINYTCYYILEDGTIATGWQAIEDHFYYFAEDGSMQTNQWIDNKHLGADDIHQRQ